MQSPTHYKNLSLESLQSKWTTPVLCTLVFFLIYFGISLITNDKDSIAMMVANILLNLALIPLSWSFAVLFLDFKREGQTSVGALFMGYQKPWFPKSLLMTLLVGIYTLLWTLLLIIPGLIKSYSYAMSSYVLRDNSEISCDEAINESMRLMDGHKWELFLLDLSFLGWLLLSILSLGIGLLWLYPYWLTAHAHFYEDLKRENNGAADDVA